ncbi:MAG TPA: 23S rRNA (uracil(1939)-C(5))-methyltransferase RlmD [Elusimicrobia bacterium]|nr:MAG: 23S rRNA (uracil-5-)-methyltransferase RumA [Elusimicrobia bacterium GWA2_66_18]OGR72335.1 MAG: 23S rRNA (uracil-5-)-methyltransferase RumA [Elusimicrobia bacterium GWC2_65_9]HAZ08344.1 23S rRNA (uracil(1939)-C(5))-methyltransferase RlmD [Elusimicrobiota bacterium]
MNETREILTVQVESMAPTGDAIARTEDSKRVVFVPHAAPGDLLEVEVFEAKSSFARARIKRVLSSGPERQDPPCPHHAAPSRPGPACGGCDWQHLNYDAQLKHKRGIILDCLRRIGKFPDGEKLTGPTKAAPHPWGYRNKVQIPFAPGPRMGFFAAGSREIVEMRECPIQPDLSVRLALTVKKMAAARGWSFYDGRTGKGWLRHLFIRTNAENQALVGLVVSRPEFADREAFAAELRAQHPEMIGLHLNFQPERTSVVLGPEWRRLWGAREMTETLGRFQFTISPGAFLQVNTPAAEVLYDEAKAAVRESGRRFPLGLDLYCGVGTLTLWLADCFPRIIGVEENREAVGDAYRNAERNAVKNCRFKAGRAEAVLPKLSSELADGSAAIVDPPRVGLSQPVRRFLTDRKLKRLVYVSCDPATFARDAGFLAHSGYTLKKVTPIDLFPQTSHVELVALMDRS